MAATTALVPVPAPLPETETSPPTTKVASFLREPGEPGAGVAPVDASLDAFSAASEDDEAFLEQWLACWQNGGVNANNDGVCVPL